MLSNLFTAFWFFLPAGFANMTPVFISKMPILKKYNYPADFYLKYKGKRILGGHKTVRGFVSGIITGVLIAYLQRSFTFRTAEISNHLAIDYLAINPLTHGALISLGALLGDSVKSFFKRRIGVKPGKSWFPFDQIDFIFGGILLSLFYVKLTIMIYALIFLIYFSLHPVSTIIGYSLKLKKDPI